MPPPCPDPAAGPGPDPEPGPTAGQVWASFFGGQGGFAELPIGYNAHRGLTMPHDEWRKVSVLHLINGHEYHRQAPPFLNKEVRTFM